MQEMLTTRVCIITDAYPFVLCIVDSKKIIWFAKVKANGLHPALTTCVIFASQHTRTQLIKSSIALEWLWDIDLYYQIENSYIHISKQKCQENFAKPLTSKLVSGIIMTIKLVKGVDVMNKEEILNRARKENNGVDEVKCAAENEAAKISIAIGLAACMLLNFLDTILLHTEVIGEACWIIYGTMITSRLWVYARCLKKLGYYIGAVLTMVFVILLCVFLLFR